MDETKTGSGHEREKVILERGNPNQFISGGMLGTFDFCPKCFEWVFLEGVERGKSEALIDGADFHEAMRQYFRGILDVDNLREPLHDWVEWTIEVEEKRKLSPGYKPPQLLEQNFIASDLLINGHPDRIDVEDGKDVLIEYKTGKSTYEQPVRIQLAFYAILVSASTGAEVEKLVMINPRLQIIKVWELDNKLIKQTAHAVAKVRYAIANGKFPQKCTVNKWQICQLCEFEDIFLKEESK